MPEQTSSRWLPIAIIGGLFFIFGFVTWLNGPLISFVQLAFELTVFKAFLVTFVFYLSYFFLALPGVHRHRRDHPAIVRVAETEPRLPAGVPVADAALLPVHPVFRAARASHRAEEVKRYE